MQFFLRHEARISLRNQSRQEWISASDFPPASLIMSVQSSSPLKIPSGLFFPSLLSFRRKSSQNPLTRCEDPSSTLCLTAFSCLSGAESPHGGLFSIVATRSSVDALSPATFDIIGEYLANSSRFVGSSGRARLAVTLLGLDRRLSQNHRHSR